MRTRTPPSLHVLCALSSALGDVPLSRLLFETVSIHLGIVFVLAPRNRHVHLQIGSVPRSLAVCLRKRSGGPNAITVPYDDFSHGCPDAQVHEVLPHASFLEGQDLYLCRFYFRSLIGRWCLRNQLIDFERCQHSTACSAIPSHRG